MLTRSTLSDVVKYAQRTLAECVQFLCAGRARFPEILQNFRAIFAQDLRHLDARLAVFGLRFCVEVGFTVQLLLASKETPTRTRVATKFCASRNHAGRVLATFARAARRKNSGTSQFFRASWAQNLRDPDAGRFPFQI